MVLIHVLHSLIDRDNVIDFVFTSSSRSNAKKTRTIRSDYGRFREENNAWHYALESSEFLCLLWCWQCLSIDIRRYAICWYCRDRVFMGKFIQRESMIKYLSFNC